MQRKSTPEELAQEALGLLEQAENFEANQEYAKAIQYYTNAAEKLKQSGYLTHRIEDIYTRITELNNYLKQQKSFSKAQTQAQLDQLQDQAFAILDAAKQLEAEGRFEDAIEQYMSAITLLAQSGWSETQLDNIKSKVMSLAESVDQQKRVQQQRQMQYQQQQSPAQAQPVNFQSQGASAQPQSEMNERQAALRAFEEKKKREEEIQNQAFAHIDNAKMFEQENQYDQAIMNYEKAIELLGSIGWNQQTENLRAVVERVKREKQQFEQSQSQQQQPQIQAPQPATATQYAMPQAVEPEFQEEKIIAYEKQKRKEEEIQNKAFNLIDIGKRLEREKKYEEAISHFQEAIELLRSIEWDSYIQPINNFIQSIKQKQQNEVQAKDLQRQRQEELSKLQQTIQSKQKEQFVESSQELEKKRQEFEKRKAEQTQKEKEFFSLLDKADALLKEGKYEDSINQYQNAKEMLNSLGAGWETYTSSINSTIENIKAKKEAQLQRKAELLKKQQKQKQEELQFQEEMAKQLEKEREKLQNKQIEVVEKEKQMEQMESKKQTAFKFLDAAQEYIKKGELEKAIYAYQNAGGLFAEIQWVDEIPLIETSIKELEKKVHVQKEKKQREMEEQIKREKQQKEFQKQVARQLQEEREKIKQKQIALHQRENEMQYREQRKQEAFKMLEGAQTQISNNNYEEAIDIYRSVANIFAEIQWQEEIDLIQNSITALQNKKQEMELRKQKQLQQQLEQQKQENEFQAEMIKKTQAQREELRKRKISLREREKEIQYREQRKNRAFQLIDKAQEFIAKNEFNKALKLYNDVANIFAQIQWTDEIPLIKNAINEIKQKKREKEQEILRNKQEDLQSEVAQNAYVEQIRRERVREREKNQHLEEIQKRQQSLSQQHLEKQQKAFGLIDEADILLKQKKFDRVIEKYNEAIGLLNEIGWTGSYLTLIQETLDNIKSRKAEEERKKQLEQKALEKQREEEQKFKMVIAEKLQKEKERMKEKQVQIQQQEAHMQYMEDRKKEAFEILDKAEILLNQGEYEESIEKYRNAELILNEIQFPTDSVREMIKKVERKQDEQEKEKLRQMELQMRKQQEEAIFRDQIAERMKEEEERMRKKQIQIKKQEEMQTYMEKRKQNAFRLLEEAETFMNRSQFDKALEYYHSAELILNEIQFPTDVIRDLISNVKAKKQEREEIQQQRMQIQLEQQKQEMEFQKKVAEDLKKEKARLKLKQIQRKKFEDMQSKLEQRKTQAFSFLEEAERYTKQSEYNKALEHYRKAQLILNELQFPTDAIKNMIMRIMKLKAQKEKQEEMMLQAQLKQIEEEKEIQYIVEERQRQERERKKAQQIALQERERLIQQQTSARQAAYQLLDEAGKYLKSHIPDYDKAISLYIQARDLLAQNIGWEPEIQNMNSLIQNLQQEKANYIRRKQLEEQARVQQQQEYEQFQQEIQRRKAEFEKQQQQQREKQRDFRESQQRAEQTRKEGLALIDEGKKAARFGNYEEAYKSFNEAIRKFQEIGWNEQIKYIQKEIENTQAIQENKRREQEEVERIQHQLEEQRKQEEKRRKEEEMKMRETIGEVGSLADHVKGLIVERRKEIQLSAQQKRQQVKDEAKSFRTNMAKMIQVKQELMDELNKAKEQEEQKLKAQEKAKEREEINDIARMIKEAAKKKKE